MNNGTSVGGESPTGPTNLNQGSKPGFTPRSSYGEKPRGFFESFFGSRRQSDIKAGKFQTAAKKMEAEKAKKYFDGGVTKLKTIGPALGPTFGKISGADSREAIGKGLGQMFGVRQSDEKIKLETVKEVYKALDRGDWGRFKDQKLAKTLRTDSGRREAFKRSLRDLDPRIKG